MLQFVSHGYGGTLYKSVSSESMCVCVFVTYRGGQRNILYLFQPIYHVSACSSMLMCHMSNTTQLFSAQAHIFFFLSPLSSFPPPKSPLVHRHTFTHGGDERRRISFILRFLINAPPTWTAEMATRARGKVTKRKRCTSYV